MAARLILVLLLLARGAFAAEPCKVLDPELQRSYAGECRNGLAEGFGFARGTAEYRGEFKAGKKHGKGAKSWPNGDRYEGEFEEDRKHGRGVYVWGRGPWQGERYEGGYLDDKRHGDGAYRWPSGDVYSGPWEEDRAVGTATEMMSARAKHLEEVRAAVRQKGQRVCREVYVGIATSEWIRGVVLEVSELQVAIQLTDAGKHRHIVAGVELETGDVIWDAAEAWTPCY